MKKLIIKQRRIEITVMNERPNNTNKNLITMKKIFLLSVICLMALAMQAQKCAVLEFRGAKSVSVSDVDGISEMFMTYFRPAGYTMVERAQIDKVISEQGFQRSNLTDDQVVEIGRILNVSKVVVGKISKLGGQYQVDVRVVDVKLGNYIPEGATFAGDYRTNVRNLANKLASKIAIKSGPTVQATSNPSTTTKSRSTVEVVYGYLKVFPNELGTFESEPTTVISQINKQAKYGYNNWRIPTNEELSLLKANNYLGSGEYMTRESRSGKVLLVSDGKDFATLKAEQRAAEQRAAEQARLKAERRAQLIDDGWVDLGLPSGTLWKSSREDNSSIESGLYTYDQAIQKYGDHIPTAEQAKELLDNCKWENHEHDLYPGNMTFEHSNTATGPNGKTLYFPNSARNFFYDCDGKRWSMNYRFWTSTLVKNNEDKAMTWHVDGVWMHRSDSPNRKLYKEDRCCKIYVWLVYNL